MAKSGWVTVVIPTYNRAHLIGEAIKSVFAQTYDHWDIIVVDDGSTDNTAEIVAQFSARVTYIRRVHSGLPAVARNVGVHLGQGEYIAFLDSDDLWLPQKLSLQVNFLKQHPKIGLVCADAYLLDNSYIKPLVRTIWNGKIPPSGRVFGSLYLWNFVHTSTVVVRRKCFDISGYFDERPIFVVCEDYHLWLRIAAHYEIAPLQHALINYRLHRKRHCNYNEERVHSSLLAVLLDIHSQYPDLVKPLANEVGIRIGDVYRSIGYSALKKGRILNVLRVFEQSAMWKKYPVQVPLLRGFIAFVLMAGGMIATKYLSWLKSHSTARSHY